MTCTHFRFISILALTAMCAVSGCAAAGRAPARSASKAVSTNEINGEYLLQLAGRLKTETALELANDSDQLQKNYTARRSEDNRLRLAAFLALAPGAAGDRNRAISLLDLPPGDANGRGRTHPVAQLLLPLLQDARRADDALGTSQLKLREEQKRSESLQQKLDAIRDIERKMLERTPVPQK
ncbi:MAG: hypothetical protein QM639_07065 [Rhodocyclaceae bacterium]